MSEAARVGLVMGSSSDWGTMQHAGDLLTQFQVPFEQRVVSAHRTPDLVFESCDRAAKGWWPRRIKPRTGETEPGHRCHRHTGPAARARPQGFFWAAWDSARIVSVTSTRSM